MDTQNHFYSHAAVLAAYCGVRRPRHVAGLVQHGWTTRSPVAANFGDFGRVDGRGRRRLLVWSHESRAWDPGTEPALTTPVGAPWLYLAALVAARQTPPGPAPAPAVTGLTVGPSTGPTVVVPVHGTRVVRWGGDQAELARQVREREGPCLVSVHHEDLDDAVVVGAWRSAGHDLVSSGSRQDPLFLLRQMSLFAGAGRLVSNRLSSAVLYAAALGVPVAVYGDPFTSPGGERAAYDEVRARWPELHGEAVEPGAATDLARRELGAVHLRQPVDLRGLLGWDRPLNVGPALDYWTRGPVEKALRVVGARQRVAARPPGTAGPLSPPPPLDGPGPGPTQEAGVGALTWLRHPLAHLPRPLGLRLPPMWPLPEPERPAG